MSETKPTYTARPYDDATDRLVELLGSDYIRLLVSILESLRAGNGYGSAEIVMLDYRIDAIREHKSHRPNKIDIANP